MGRVVVCAESVVEDVRVGGGGIVDGAGARLDCDGRGASRDGIVCQSMRRFLF